MPKTAETALNRDRAISTNSFCSEVRSNIRKEVRKTKKLMKTVMNSKKSVKSMLELELVSRANSEKNSPTKTFHGNFSQFAS